MGISQRDFAKLTGKSLSFIQFMESNKSNPQSKSLIEISSRLGVTVDGFLAGPDRFAADRSSSYKNLILGRLKNIKDDEEKREIEKEGRDLLKDQLKAEEIKEVNAYILRSRYPRANTDNIYLELDPETTITIALWNFSQNSRKAQNEIASAYFKYISEKEVEGKF